MDPSSIKRRTVKINSSVASIQKGTQHLSPMAIMRLAAPCQPIDPWPQRIIGQLLLIFLRIPVVNPVQVIPTAQQCYGLRDFKIKLALPSRYRMRQNELNRGLVMVSSGVESLTSRCPQVNDIRAPKTNRESLGPNHASRESKEYISKKQ